MSFNKSVAIDDNVTMAISDIAKRERRKFSSVMNDILIVGVPIYRKKNNQYDGHELSEDELEDLTKMEENEGQVN